MTEPRRCPECGELMPTVGICYCMESYDYGEEDDYPDGYDEIDDDIPDDFGYEEESAFEVRDDPHPFV